MHFPHPTISMESSLLGGRYAGGYFPFRSTGGSRWFVFSAVIDISSETVGKDSHAGMTLAVEGQGKF